MSEKEKQQIVAEVNILRELKHPNIVRYYDRIIDKVKAKNLYHHGVLRKRRHVETN